jgi:hypothetical protein
MHAFYFEKKKKKKTIFCKNILQGYNFLNYGKFMLTICRENIFIPVSLYVKLYLVKILFIKNNTQHLIILCYENPCKCTVNFLTT